VQGIGDLFADVSSLLFTKTEPYASPCDQALDHTEERSHPRPIDYYESQELKSYRLWQQSHPDLVTESDIYPIADVNDPDVIRQLMRLEELFHYRFGIAYKSRYNTMVVDPIVGGTQGYFPYDRTVPTAGKDGVVAVAMYQGRFILLRQYRHAIRQEQYSFPRGYAEPEDTPVENAQRELREELHAVIEKEPVFLGRIASDSGLTSCQAYVYLVELAALEPSVGHEGILNHVAVTPAELKVWIQDKKITDGFTLGAFSLYEARES
jgi:ADP-ribose pyrophosphatase